MKIMGLFYFLKWTKVKINKKTKSVFRFRFYYLTKLEVFIAFFILVGLVQLLLRLVLRVR